MIDRRGMHLRPSEGLDDILVDRFKFDHDDDGDESPVYGIDPFDISRMRYRAKIAGSHHGQSQVQAPRRPQTEASSTNQQSSTQPPDLGTHSSRSRPA